MANISGISDKIQVLKEVTYADGGVFGEKVFGVTKRFEWRADTSTQQSYGLETTGPGACSNTDGVLQMTGTHEWEFTDGRELEAILGTGTGTGGKFTLDVANSLPSYSVKVVEDSTNYSVIKGIKYSKFSINLTRGEEPITITADWFGKEIVTTTSFTPTCATVEPLMYLDGCFAITGTYQTGIEDFTLEIDRACQPRRFMEQTSALSRRLISEIIEGPLAITYNGNMASKRKVLEEIWGGGSIADVRSDKTLSLHIGRGSTELDLTITGMRHNTSGRILEKTQEVSLMDFSGVGLDISGTGTYSA